MVTLMWWVWAATTILSLAVAAGGTDIFDDEFIGGWFFVCALVLPPIAGLWVTTRLLVLWRRARADEDGELRAEARRLASERRAEIAKIMREEL